MSSRAIRRQIEARTQHAFGKPAWPHLFRDCAVTELVDTAPEEIGIAPDLLGVIAKTFLDRRTSRPLAFERQAQGRVSPGPTAKEGGR